MEKKLLNPVIFFIVLGAERLVFLYCLDRINRITFASDIVFSQVFAAVIAALVALFASRTARNPVLLRAVCVAVTALAMGLVVRFVHIPDPASAPKVFAISLIDAAVWFLLGLGAGVAAQMVSESGDEAVAGDN